MPNPFSQMLQQIVLQTLSNPDFQGSLLNIFKGLGSNIRNHATKPQALMQLADDLEHRPDTLLAAAVKNTEGEKLVDEHLLKKADQIQV